MHSTMLNTLLIAQIETAVDKDLQMAIATCIMAFVSATMITYFGWPYAKFYFNKQSEYYDLVLNEQLLYDMNAKAVVGGIGVGIVVLGFITYTLFQTILGAIVVMVITYFIPLMIVKHLHQKRKIKLEAQLVDALTTISSGVRANLNLVQSIQLLANESHGEVKQEFTQLLKEYELGVDLHQAMRNTADRIGSQHYRLVFTALQAHRERGGNMAESLDRISDVIREIQRLEGKLQSMTAQGRSQARFMSIMPVVMFGILFVIFPKEVKLLITQPLGRLLLLISVGLILGGYFCIKRIMNVDI